MLMVNNYRRDMLIAYLCSSVMCSPESRFGSSLSWNYVTTDKQLSSFTSHLVTIKLGLTSLFWIVWKLFGTEQCLSSPPPVLCRRLSHPGPDVSTGTMYHPWWPHSVLFIRPRPRPRGSGSSSHASNLCPLPCSFTLSRSTSKTWRVFVWVGWRGGSSDQGSGASVESQWLQRANKNRRQCAALGRLNICSDNILTGASLMGGWCANMCIYTYISLYKNCSHVFHQNWRKSKLSG